MDKITLHGPGDLAAAVPYQLGYYPHDSLVVVALSDGRRVDFTQRIDLPGPEHVDDAVEVLLGPALREGVDTLLLAAFEEEPGDGLALCHALADACDAHGIRVRVAVRVHDGRWWGVDCRDDCCPPEGTAVPDAVAAEFVAAGRAPLASRERLADLVAPDGSQSEVLAALRARGPSGRWAGEAFGLGPVGEPAPETAGADSLWAGLVDGSRAPGDLGPDDVADMVLSLRDKMWRDGLIAVIVPGSLPMEAVAPEIRERLAAIPPAHSDRTPEGWDAREALTGRLLALCRRVPDEHAADLLCVTATLLWWRGNGALARIALDRGLAAAPAHRLSLLTAQLIDHGVRPGRPWEDPVDDVGTDVPWDGPADEAGPDVPWEGPSMGVA
ncbi:MAG: DUF4192 domain-containing protein [Micrococcales bacterium]|nr:DUF4192 domain-containing protein [Micrococcales bacterium]